MKKWRKRMSKKTGTYSMGETSNKMKSISMLTIGLLMGSWWGKGKGEGESLVVVWYCRVIIGIEGKGR